MNALKYFNKDSRCLGRNPNRTPPKYMAGVVVTLYITDSAACWVGITELSKDSERKTIQYEYDFVNFATSWLENINKPR